MQIEQLAERVTALERAFGEFTGNVPGLTVEVVGHVAGIEDLVHPMAGFLVHLQRARGESGVELYVTTTYGELTRWSAGGNGGPGAVRERFQVDLREDYAWGDTTFPTPDALASALLAYMQFNLDAIAG